MKYSIYIICISILQLLNSCNGKIIINNQLPSNEGEKIVGGGCDGCEIMFQDMPKNLSSIDTSAGWNEQGQKLVVEGTVFNLDAKVPASDVIIYYWHTDNSGKYSKTANQKTLHGHLRGWMKTSSNGTYKLFTIRPASYTESVIPAHIHFAIKEPRIKDEYYIDDILFNDDKFLTKIQREQLENRGGNGIGNIRTQNKVQYIKRDILLGLNIPDYPKH